MRNLIFSSIRLGKTPCLMLLLATFFGACSVAEPKTTAYGNSNQPINPVSSVKTEVEPNGATIDVEPNGPADTVRVFYKNLRDRKFREAIFLTNLRPAIEGLTEVELKDFSLDFEAIAGQIPAEIQINGEIISGDKATVTANLPNEDGDKHEIQKINLRKGGDVWVILTVDDAAEARIKKEGKNYFYNLRIETHEEEARKMLERISNAELAYSLQHGGAVADMQTLITAGLLPADVTSSQSTGYIYVINLAESKRRYFATATPAIYGKSGKLSFILKIDSNGISHVSSKDTAGKPMSN